jgi:hypothetical protein
MLSRILAHELSRFDIPLVVLHPGWVRTKEANAMAPLSPEESVKGMAGLIEGLDMETTGRFLTHEGEPYPW